MKQKDKEKDKIQMKKEDGEKVVKDNMENSEDRDKDLEDKDLVVELKPVGFKKGWMEYIIKKKFLLLMELELWIVSVFSMGSDNNWEEILLLDMMI